MSRYMIQFDLASLCGQLSQSLGCYLDPADVREILIAAGLEEAAGDGWPATCGRWRCFTSRRAER